MKKLKNTFILLLLVSFFPLVAFDFGVNIGDITDFSKNSDFEINQTNTLSVWFSTPIKDFSLTGSAIYKFNYAWTAQNQTLKPFQIDVGDLKFSGFLTFLGENSSGLRFDMGRIQVADITGRVFSAKSDGAHATWIYKNIALGAQVYYTGLTLKNNSSIFLSPQDVADRSNDSVLFGSKRIVYSVYGLFQEFLLRQNFNIEVLGQNDVRIGADPRVHTYYGSANLSGPIFSVFRYSLGSSFGVYQSGKNFDFGQLILANLSLRIPSKNTNLILSGIYTMPWGTSNTSFVPVNSQSVSLVLPELKQNTVTFIGFESAWQPASFFSGGLKTNVYLKQNATSLPLNVIKSDSTSLFVGTEFSLYGRFFVSSEFSFLLSSGLFIINPLITVDGASILPFRISLAATLRI